jgi:hypothetical protein
VPYEVCQSACLASHTDFCVYGRFRPLADVRRTWELRPIADSGEQSECQVPCSGKRKVALGDDYVKGERCSMSLTPAELRRAARPGSTVYCSRAFGGGSLTASQYNPSWWITSANWSKSTGLQT